MHKRSKKKQALYKNGGQKVEPTQGKSTRFRLLICLILLKKHTAKKKGEEIRRQHLLGPCKKQRNLKHLQPPQRTGRSRQLR